MHFAENIFLNLNRSTQLVRAIELLFHHHISREGQKIPPFGINYSFILSVD